MRTPRWSAVLTAILAALALTWLTLSAAAQAAPAAAAPPAGSGGAVQAGGSGAGLLPEHPAPSPTPVERHYSPAPQRWAAPPGNQPADQQTAPAGLAVEALSPASGGDWDGRAVDYPRVISATGQYWMWYLGGSTTNPGYGWALGLATSPDGWTWTKDAGNPVLGLGDPGDWDEMFRGQPALLADGGVFKMWYSGGGTGVWQTGYATSTNGVDWDVYGGNPVLPAGGVGAWDEGEADGPSVIYDGGEYKLWYHGGNADYSQFAIGYATSPDGLVWTKYAGNPVLTGTVGEWDEGFVSFPRVIKTGGTYELWYFANGQIGLATSPDGLVWTKAGENPLLKTGWNGNLRGFDVWRAGSLYQLWFTNVNGGERSIGYAESADGLSWTMPVSNPVLSPGHAGLVIDVNYAHDWVMAFTAPGAGVAITVSDGSGVKSEVSGTADGNGEFHSWEWSWSSGQPDFLPGDLVTASTDLAETFVNPVGVLDGVLDADSDRFTGTLAAAWFAPLTLTVRCDVWVDNGPSPVYAYGVAADGGSFVCDFAGVWDLERGQDVAVRYLEPDNDTVINVFRQYPLDLDLQVNVGHDWVEGSYEPGHTLYLTVTDGLGVIKTTATLTTGIVPWWGGSNNSGFTTNLPPVAGWSPPPDLQPGDWVYARMDNGYTATVRLGDITGAVDSDADTVAGTVTAAWLSFPLDLRCEVWEPGGPGYDLSVATNGGGYLCDTTADWELQPGHDVAISYGEPDGDRVINIFQGPVPHVSLELWADGAPAVGGNFALNVRYYNHGDAPAPDSSIQLDLTNADYLGDTAPGGHTGSGAGPIIFDLGELPPHSTGQFYVFVTVTGAEGEDLLATTEIGTGSPYNEGDPSERHASWIGGIVANDTQLTVDQGTWTWEPLPGEDYVYELNVCNKGSTASTAATLTDTLPALTTLVSWSGAQPGWSEQSSTAGELVLTRPTMPGYGCSQVRVRVHLSPAATPETLLSNTATVAAANDLDPNDNTHTLEHHPGPARHNLWIDKNWGHGQLIPGGQAHYWLDFGNNGNQAVTHTVRLTETIPAGLTFVDAVRVNWADIEAPVTPTLVTAEAVVFTFTDLPAGYADAIRVNYAIGPVPSGTSVTNCATIADGSFEHDPYDNTACETETVRAGPNLRIVKLAEWNGPNNLHYRVRIENVGSTLVENVAVTDTFPAGLTLDDWNFGFWQAWEGLVTGHQLTLTLSRLEPTWSTNLNMWLSGSPAAGTLLTNTAQITLPPGDSDPADNTASAVLGVGPDLALDQWRSAGTPGVGQLVTFTLHFANQGAWDTAGAVRLTETLPTGLAFVSAHKRFCDGAYFCAAPPDGVNGPTLTWNWNGPDGVGAGWWNDLLVTVRVTNTLALGAVFTSTAQIASLAPGVDVDPFPANNWAQTVINFPIVKLFVPLILR